MTFHPPAEEQSSRQRFEAAHTAGVEGDWQSVVSLLEQVMPLDEPGAVAGDFLLLGQALTQLGRHAEAAEVYGSACQKWPGESACWRGVAYAAGKCGNWADAAAAWKTSLDLTQNGHQLAWWWGAYVDCLNKLGRYAEGKEAAAELRRRWPEDASGWRNGAFIATKTSDWSAAAELWQGFIDRSPAGSLTPSQVSSLAQALLQSGHAEAARPHFETLCARWPDEPAGWRGLATAVAGRRGWPTAARALSLLVTPDRIFATAAEKEILTVFRRAGCFEDAACRIAKLRLAHPEDQYWQRSQIDLCLARGDERGAWAALVESMTRAPGANPVNAQFAALHARNAGLTAAEVRPLLEQWFGLEAGGLALRQAFAFLVPVPGAEIPTWKAESVSLPGENWSRQVRLKLRAFLRERNHGHFHDFASLAIRHADQRQLTKLALLAARRFPRSRIAVQLRQMLSGARGETPCDIAFASRWRATLPLSAGHSITPDLAGRPWRRLVCAVVVRDEEELLQLFIAHYRGLGIDSFIVIDNGSAADLRASLPSDGAEITLVRHEARFSEVHHGMTWVNEILESGCCDWLLFADCDEFLIYPGSSELPLPELVAHLDERGETALAAPMLDVCDRGFLAGDTISPEIADHRFFDASWITERDLQPPWRKIQGGVRSGLVGTLTKTPLVKASAGVRYTNNHYVSACHLAEMRGALVHYKIFRDRTLMSLAAAEVAAHSRIRERGNACIARHLALAQAGASPREPSPFLLGLSEAALLRIGYIAADPAWAARMTPPPPANLFARAEEARQAIARRRAITLPGRLAEASCRQMLSELQTLAAEASRHELRNLLKASLARSEAIEAKLAMLIVAAAALRRADLGRRLTKRLGRWAKLEHAQFDISALTDLAALVADQPQTVIDLLEIVAACGRLAPRDRSRLASLYRRAGRFSDAMTLLNSGDLRSIDRTVFIYLDSLRGQRQWERYYRTMEDILRAPDLVASRELLPRITMCPDDHMQQYFLERLHARLTQGWENHRAEQAAVHLAVLCRLGRGEECGEAFDHLSGRLSPNPRRFFTRLFGRDESVVPTETVWGLGLSKTGTTSLHDYCSALGLLCAHFVNDFLGTIIDERDASLFDVISDTPAVYLAQTTGLPDGSRAVATLRDFDSWRASFLIHFQRQFAAPDAGFDVLRRIVADERLAYGQCWKDMHWHLYFRFADLRAAHEHQVEWLSEAGKRVRLLRLNMEESDSSKAALLSGFLGLRTAARGFPRRNETMPAGS